MLQQLYIQNYAIIDELEIGLSEGLNILTGETGAGKSIIMGALGLILGQRADSGALLNKERKCVVEGRFSVSGKNAVLAFLRENDLDVSDELLLRREIGVNGKSRAFVNDSPVTVAQLQELSEMLVDLHQQFDTLNLRESDFQREVLDALAGHQSLLDEYREVFRQWQEARLQLESLQRRQEESAREADYNRFQFEELRDAGFRENEIEAAEAELKLLQHAEDITATLQAAQQELEEGEAPIVHRLKVLQQQLQQVAPYHAALPVLLERLSALQIELRDVAGELERTGAGIVSDPARLNQLSERISLGYRLQKKHGVKSTAELLQVQAALEAKLRDVTDLDASIERLSREVAALGRSAEGLAAKLTAGRNRELVPFAEAVNRMLHQVGMPNARLVARLQAVPLHAGGADQVEFLLDANLPAGKSESQGRFQPIGKVASGGELSRVMLCIKSLVAQSADLPTLIFDEIDTGISGEAARQVGVIMQQLAKRRQVICITHQPQIAGRARSHFFVYKEKQRDRVRTGVRLLNTEERIEAIARMLGGDHPSAAALQNAREMVLQ